MHALDSNQLLSLFSEAYPGLVAYLDSEYRYHFASDQYRSWFGIDPQSLIGKYAYEILGNQEFEARKPMMDRSLAGEKVTFRCSLNHSTLGKRELDQIYQPDFGPDKNVRGFIVMALDVTEKVFSEKKAHANEARFRSLSELIPQLVWVADLSGQGIYFNKNWQLKTGTTLEENLGLGWFNVVHPDEKQLALSAWINAINTKSDFDSEYRLKMSDGTYRWHVTRGKSVSNDEGIIEKWVGTTTDIEDQKNARDIALAEKERIYSLFMQAPAIICVLNGPNHIFELFNHSARKYLGSRDLTGLSMRQTIPELEGEGLVKILDEVYQTGSERTIDSIPLSIRQKDGSSKVHFFDLYYKPLKDESGKVIGIFNIGVDVTKQAIAHKKLEDALKSRDEFLSIASHELKTPLTSLKLQSQLTLRSLNREDAQGMSIEKQKSLAYQTNELITRLSRLIDDMLDVSRIRTGKLHLDKTENNLLSIVEDVVSRMNLQFEIAGLGSPQIIAESNVVGRWDRFRLEQVVSNLLTNAIRYGQGKPIELDIRHQDNFALLSVRDYGYGISAEDIKRIFGRFERAIDKSEVSGMGLGLFITKEIVAAHGGEIWVDSHVGKGSTFFVSLPLS